jgi:hypothetical protein
MNMDITPYMPLIYAVLSGIAYAAVGYFTKTSESDFDFKKFASTIMTSLVVVAGLIQTGQTITQATIEQQMAAYFMLTVIFQKILDAIFRKVQPVQKIQKLQGILNPAITFNATPAMGDTPLKVTFTDTSGDIVYFATGEGYLNWDTPRQKTITHTYQNPGIYEVRAFTSSNTFSNPVIITVTGATPVPTPPVVKKSWLEVLWDIIKAFFHIN